MNATRWVEASLFVATACLMAAPAFAQAVGGNGGGTTMAPVVTYVVNAFVLGVVELAVIYIAGRAIFGNHVMAATVGAVIAALVLGGYVNVAQLLLNGVAGIGGAIGAA